MRDAGDFLFRVILLRRTAQGNKLSEPYECYIGGNRKMSGERRETRQGTHGITTSYRAVRQHKRGNHSIMPAAVTSWVTGTIRGVGEP